MPETEFGSAIDMDIQDTPSGLRSGVAKITANSGAGVYTITEQWRTAGGANQDAVDPPGLVAVAAREVDASENGAVDDVVRFWQQRKLDGTAENIILVTTKVVGGKGMFTIVHSIKLAANLGDGTFTISPLDLSGKLLVHESRALTNTALGDNNWEAGIREHGTYDVPAAPAMDYILNDWDSTSYSLEIDNDGTLQWDWQDKAYDRYAQCIVHVYNSFPDDTET